MNTFISKFLEKDILVFFLILTCLLVAFSPAYLFDYFRHDDWAGVCWDRSSISSHHLFSASVFYELRPYTMIFLFYPEFLTESIEGAKFVKISSILILALTTFLIFRWFIQFNTSRIFAFLIPIILFTLPPFQIMASSFHYFFMIVPILLSVIYVWLCWDIANIRKENIKIFLYVVLFIQIITFLTLNRMFMITSFFTTLFVTYLYYRYSVSPSHKNYNLLMYFMGFILFITSITAYPMSAMFIWFMIALPVLMIHEYKNKDVIISFLWKTTIFSILIMLFYFIFGKVYAFIFNIDMDYDRGMSLALSIEKIFFQALESFRIASNFWDIREYYPIKDSLFNYINLYAIFSIFAFSLFFFIKKIRLRFKFLIIIFVGMLLFFSISPLIVSKMEAIMFRYLVSLAPLLGLLFFWSLYIFYLNFKDLKIFNFIAVFSIVTTTYFSIYLSNISILNYLVKPNQYEITYIENFLKEDIIDKIKTNEKVNIQVITGRAHYTPNRYSLDEYSMSINVFRWPVLPTIIMLLKQNGVYVPTNGCMPEKWEPDHIIFNMEWAKLEIFSGQKPISESSNNKTYIIDMNKLEDMN